MHVLNVSKIDRIDRQLTFLMKPAKEDTKKIFRRRYIPEKLSERTIMSELEQTLTSSDGHFAK